MENVVSICYTLIQCNIFISFRVQACDDIGDSSYVSAYLIKENIMWVRAFQLGHQIYI